MGKSQHLFGWKIVFKNYGLKSFLIDSVFPILISVILCWLLYIHEVELLIQLDKLLNICISILPVIITLIITAYTILTVFIADGKLTSVINREKGKNLVRILNSSFAACLAISTLTMITVVIVSLIKNIGITSEYAKHINYTVYFIICFLLMYSLIILIGIIEDIFNCGQTSLKDK